MESPLISVTSLFAKSKEENLKIIDVSMKTVIGKQPIINTSLTVIPNSIYLDLSSDLVDTANQTVHAFPLKEQVLDALLKLGITQKTTIVLYDKQGIYSSPRVWWVLRSFGVENVYILDGGLPAWIKQGYPTSSKYNECPMSLNAPSLTYSDNAVVTKQQVLDNISNPKFSVLDVRASSRFLGEVQDPRKGVRSGHIPKSINFPFETVLNDNKYKSPEELQNIFSEISNDKSVQLAFSCGSGITACITLVAALLAGYHHVSLYDGSWSEWGSDMSLPIE